ncbi:MAG: DUF4097 domain-containing protein [Gemmatimonadetes bacterium]|nr:DUF4097 domain-containing protein [Gemmatimonadota bacterium]
MRTRTFFSILTSLIVIPGALIAQGDREETFFDRSFDVRSGGRLHVDLGDMNIHVASDRGGTVGNVRVVARARDMAWAREVFDEMDFQVAGSGGDLRLETRDHRMSWREWRNRGWVDLTAIVTVPAEYDLELKTGDGDIRIGRASGRVVAQTGDGDISIDAATGAAIELSTGDGDVTAESLSAEDIRLHTGDGDVRLESVSGPISARTGDGDIALGIERFEGLTVRTGDGDVWLEVDRSIAADVDIEGDDLSLGRALAVSGRVREGSVQGELNGGGPELRVRTGDGDVTIRAR